MHELKSQCYPKLYFINFNLAEIAKNCPAFIVITPLLRIANKPGIRQFWLKKPRKTLNLRNFE